ncbi:13040_t:CDS:2 [Rhizophagus irregularis]|nr:13040_t:CDS:2 [Rhizophagus irregularis]
MINIFGSRSHENQQESIESREPIRFPRNGRTPRYSKYDRIYMFVAIDQLRKKIFTQNTLDQRKSRDAQGVRMIDDQDEYELDNCIYSIRSHVVTQIKRRSKSSNKSNPRKIKHNKSNQTSSQHDDEPRINKVQGSLSNDGEKTFKWKSSEPSLKTDKPTGFVLPSSFKSEKSDQSNVPGFSSNDTNKPIGFGFGSFKSEKSEHSNVPGFSSIKSDETSRFSPNDTNKPIGFGFGSFKSEKSEHSNVPGFSSIKSDEPNRFSSNDTNKFTVSGSSSLFKSEKSEHSNVPGLSSDELKRFSFMYGLPSSFLKSEKSEQSNVSGFSSIKSDELKRFSSNDTDELLGYGLPSSFLKSEKSEQSNVSGFSSIKSDEPKQLSLNDTDEFPGFGLSSFKSEKSERRN